MTAFYNEIDPYAAAWLRNLIAAGHIAPGVVDERSIADLDPDELDRYTQCHFFAGIGVWSHALRLAGVPDDRPLWTGSCPCQPFSAAGKGAGIADERHLWPAFFRLISKCRPELVFGEQVSGRAGIDWLAAVHLDLQAESYAVGAAALPACSVGAPHIRERLFFVAHADQQPSRQGRADTRGCDQRSDAKSRPGLGGSELAGLMADADGRIASEGSDSGLAGLQRSGEQRLLAPSRGTDIVGDTGDEGLAQRLGQRSIPSGADAGQAIERASVHDGAVADADAERRTGDAGPLGRVLGGPFGALSDGSSFWEACDWLPCRDGKARPAQARIQQMVDGVALRVGFLCPARQAEIEEIVGEAEKRLQTEAGALLREVRHAARAADLFGPGGGLRRVHEAQILLSYVLEHAWQEGRESDTTNGAGESFSQGDVRVAVAAWIG